MEDDKVENASTAAICNLIYRYVECVSNCDLAGAAALFEHARLKMRSGEMIGHVALRGFLEKSVIVHEDGTARTKPIVTNPILEIDEDAGTATCRSQYMILQQLEGRPIEIIAAGRYYDKFERVDGAWRFSFRDYSMLDMVGDLSSHIRGMPAPQWQ